MQRGKGMKFVGDSRINRDRRPQESRKTIRSILAELKLFGPTFY